MRIKWLSLRNDRHQRTRTRAYLCRGQSLYYLTKKIMRTFIILLLCAVPWASFAQETYAEKLGFPKGAKVLILHIDDGGMSWDSNEGVTFAMEKGVANSVSIMMPCPWVPGFVHYLKEHPTLDAGLHLTMTSEWRDYRWGPLCGKPLVPGLVDREGAMWPSVQEVVQHASADEVEKEIRAQLDRARTMGFEPTHFDSHMGTLFETREFLERYIKVGIENNIPVMFPGGHNTHIAISEKSLAPRLKEFQDMGKKIWDAGLPVLDDLHNVSYGWTSPAEASDRDLQKFYVQKYIETINELKPGLTMVIMHCTWPSEVFPHISGSGTKRKGDLLAMMAPEFKKFLNDQKIILTTWRELKQRRDKWNPKK